MLNEQQRLAVQMTEGPLLLIAGPGTGKTRTLVERTAHILREGMARGDQVTVTTFTKKAAAELRQRISLRLKADGRSQEAGQVHIGNFHQLAREILDAFPQYLDYKPLYRQMDDLEQNLLVLDHWDFLVGEDLDLLLPGLRQDYYGARNLARLLNQLREGFADLSGEAAETLCARRLLARYQTLLLQENCIDYSGLLAAGVGILRDHEDARAFFQERATYLMVDEYQDTNPIQEEMVRLLSGGRGNLCVVGDDDQSLYRFRGAHVGNLLTFADRYPGAQTLYLEENYRSDGAILALAADFINRPYGDAGGRKDPLAAHRFQKHLRASSERGTHPNAVLSVLASETEAWADQLVACIVELRGQVSSYRDIALLAYSLRSDQVTILMHKLREAGVPLYAPRQASLLAVRSVQQMIACLLRLFQPWLAALHQRRPDLRGNLDGLTHYLSSLPKKGTEDRARVVAQGQAAIRSGEADLLGLAYDFLACPPFAGRLDQALQGEGAAQEESRALAVFFGLLEKYWQEWCRREGGKSGGSGAGAAAAPAPRLESTAASEARAVSEAGAGEALTEASSETAAPEAGSWQTHRDFLPADPAGLAAFCEDFFAGYLPLLAQARPDALGGEEVGPVEDDRLQLMTIHQSKGLEFPVVVLLEPLKPRKVFHKRKEGVDRLKRNPALGPQQSPEQEEELDRLRLYYTAMTRAQSLLVLTGVEDAGLDPAFRALNLTLRPWKPGLDLGFPLAQAQPVIHPRAYAYTTDIETYRACPRQYFFFRLQAWPRPKTAQQAYGSLVHESLKVVNRRLIELGQGGGTDKTGEPGGIQEAGKLEGAEPAEISQPVQALLADLSAIIHSTAEGLTLAGLPVEGGLEARALASLTQYLSEAGDRVAREGAAVEETWTRLEGEDLLEGTMDLLFQDGSLLDFKTGTRRAAAEAGYRGQLLYYRLLLGGGSAEAAATAGQETAEAGPAEDRQEEVSEVSAEASEPSLEPAAASEAPSGSTTTAKNYLYYLDEDVPCQVFPFSPEEEGAFRDQVQATIAGIKKGQVAGRAGDPASCRSCPMEAYCFAENGGGLA